MKSVMGEARAVLARDMLIAARIGGGGLLAVVFFALVVTMIPFGLGRENLGLLASIGPGILWVGVLLATLLTLDRLFQADFEDGTLELLAASPFPLTGLVLVKCLAHWLLTAVPLILASPLLGLMTGMDPGATPGLMLALLCGTPALSLVGAVGAALTVGLRRGGLLLSLLVVPLTVPVLIFGTAAAQASAEGGAAFTTTHLLVLAASLFAFAFGPVSAAGALRLNLS